jgi:hypothetical protein
MKVLQQTPQRLVIGTPTSAIFITRLIGLAISCPGFLVLAIFFLGGSGDYSSLNCQRNRPTQQQCRFLRLSLVRPFYYRFPIADLQSIKLQTLNQPQRGPSGYRLRLQIADRSFPLAVGYSRPRNQQLQLQAQIQALIDDPTSPALVIRQWPSGWALVVAIAFFIPTLPLTWLVIFIAACPVVICFDKATQQLTITTQGVFKTDTKHCSFQAIDRIFVERTLLSTSSHSKSPPERYPLFISLRSGQQFFRYDYFQKQPADEIAQCMVNFLKASG